MGGPSNSSIVDPSTLEEIANVLTLGGTGNNIASTSNANTAPLTLGGTGNNIASTSNANPNSSVYQDPTDDDTMRDSLLEWHMNRPEKKNGGLGRARKSRSIYDFFRAWCLFSKYRQTVV